MNETVPALGIATLDDFADVDEPGATPLLGTDDEVVIAEGSDAMVYGAGGGGKSTAVNDLAFHLAAGDPWCGIPVPRPLRVLIAECEGPRPLFRKKVRRKRDGWAGSPIDGRLFVVEYPWADFSFVDDDDREALAATIRDLEIDIVFIGPLTRIGMDEAGTLQQTRDFSLLLQDTRRRSQRRVSLVLIHHEGKHGSVSGAWEGVGDLLIHVQAQGHGRTRLFFQKVRWSSRYHQASLNLTWAEGEGFQLDDAPELDDATITNQILEHIQANPGTPWGKVEEATPGVNRKRRMNIRDGLFSNGRIVNIVKQDGEEIALRHCPERKQAHLFLASDPTIEHLLPTSGAVGEQTAPDREVRAESASAPCSPAIKGSRGVGADPHLPQTTASQEELTWR